MGILIPLGVKKAAICNDGGTEPNGIASQEEEWVTGVGESDGLVGESGLGISKEGGANGPDFVLANGLEVESECNTKGPWDEKVGKSLSGQLVNGPNPNIGPGQVTRMESQGRSPFESQNQVEGDFDAVERVPESLGEGMGGGIGGR